MVDVTSTIIINRPVFVVSEFAGNPDNAPQWYVNIKSAEWKTEGDLSVGSQIMFKAEFLGRLLTYKYEITEFVPSEKLVMQTADGPFFMKTTYIWEPINSETTKMVLRNFGSPAGFSKLFAPFMTFAMKRANKKDLKLLKLILEEQ